MQHYVRLHYTVGRRRWILHFFGFVPDSWLSRGFVCVCIREFITAVEASSERRHPHIIFMLGLHFMETLSCEVFEMSGGVC